VELHWKGEMNFGYVKVCKEMIWISLDKEYNSRKELSMDRRKMFQI
jgi:hypothetical protein